MRRAVMIASLALASYALAAGAQAAPAAPAGIKLSDVAGTWTVKSMVGPKDSVVITTTVTQTADGKGATMQFAKGEPIRFVWLRSVGTASSPKLGPIQAPYAPARR